MWFFSSNTEVTSGTGNPHGKWKDSLGSQADLRAVQGAIFLIPCHIWLKTLQGSIISSMK